MGSDEFEKRANSRYEMNFIKDIRIGFFSYLFLESQLSNRLSVDCGLGYSQRGIDMDYWLNGFGVNLPLSEKITLGFDVRNATGLTNVSAKYEENRFQNFGETTRNISFETGLKLLYALK